MDSLNPGITFNRRVIRSTECVTIDRVVLHKPATMDEAVVHSQIVDLEAGELPHRTW